MRQNAQNTNGAPARESGPARGTECARVQRAGLQHLSSRHRQISARSSTRRSSTRPRRCTSHEIDTSDKQGKGTTVAPRDVRSCALSARWRVTKPAQVFSKAVDEIYIIHHYLCSSLDRRIQNFEIVCRCPQKMNPKPNRTSGRAPR